MSLPIVKTTIAFEPSPTVTKLLRQVQQLGQAGHLVVWFLAPPEAVTPEGVDPKLIAKQPDLKLEPGVNSFSFDAPVGAIAQIYISGVDAHGNVSQGKLISFRVEPHALPKPVGAIYVQSVVPKLSVVNQEPELEVTPGRKACSCGCSHDQNQVTVEILAHPGLPCPINGVVMGVEADGSGISVALEGERTVILGAHDPNITVKVHVEGITMCIHEYVEHFLGGNPD